VRDLSASTLYSCGKIPIRPLWVPCEWIAWSRVSPKSLGIGSAFCSSVAQTERSAAVLLILTEKQILFARPNLSAVAFRIRWQPFSISHPRRTELNRMCSSPERRAIRAVAQHAEPASSSLETRCIGFDRLEVTLFKSTLVGQKYFNPSEINTCRKSNGGISVFASTQLRTARNSSEMHRYAISVRTHVESTLAENRGRG
jgi:hypothetical protein